MEGRTKILGFILAMALLAQAGPLAAPGSSGEVGVQERLAEQRDFLERFFDGTEVPKGRVVAQELKPGTQLGTLPFATQKRKILVAGRDPVPQPPRRQPEPGRVQPTVWKVIKTGWKGVLGMADASFQFAKERETMLETERAAKEMKDLAARATQARFLPGLWNGKGHQVPTAAELEQNMVKVLKSLKEGQSVIVLLAFRISGDRIYSEAVGVHVKGGGDFWVTYMTMEGEEFSTGDVWGLGYDIQGLVQLMKKNIAKLFNEKEYNKALGRPSERRDMRIYLLKGKGLYTSARDYYQAGEIPEEIVRGYYTPGSKWVWGDQSNPAAPPAM